MQKIELTKFLKIQKTVTEKYDSEMETAAKRSGITKQEADVLLFFFNNPECSLASDAVRLRGFSKAYASKAIEQLEINGIIKVTADSADKRMQRITLSGKGGIIAKALSLSQKKFFEKLLIGVTPEEKFILENILSKIGNNALNLL